MVLCWQTHTPVKSDCTTNCALGGLFSAVSFTKNGLGACKELEYIWTKLRPCGMKKEADNKDGKWECAQKEGSQTHGWVMNYFSHYFERSWTCSNLFTDSWL